MESGALRQRAPGIAHPMSVLVQPMEPRADVGGEVSAIASDKGRPSPRSGRSSTAKELSRAPYATFEPSRRRRHPRGRGPVAGIQGLLRGLKVAISRQSIPQPLIGVERRTDQVLTLRCANLQDIVWMKHLNEAYLPENYPVEFWQKTLLRFPGASFVAEGANGQVVGYVLGKMDLAYGLQPSPPAAADTKAAVSRKKPDSSDSRKTHRTTFMNEGKILSLCVRDGYRGQGIGKGLLAASVNAMRLQLNADFVSLRVRQDTNPGALALYKKMNFFVSDVVKNYYRDGENALLMIKNFR
uniref:N-acetyltransferase domain-containing protein n=1 Tax=Lotharella oceanica TaxID=641309 RepID=A0A7S2TX68_9EUKA